MLKHIKYIKMDEKWDSGNKTGRLFRFLHHSIDDVTRGTYMSLSIYDKAACSSI